jgi:hypothetical protein
LPNEARTRTRSGESTWNLTCEWSSQVTVTASGDVVWLAMEPMGVKPLKSTADAIMANDNRQ